MEQLKRYILHLPFRFSKKEGEMFGNIKYIQYIYANYTVIEGDELVISIEGFTDLVERGYSWPLCSKMFSMWSGCECGRLKSNENSTERFLL